MNGREGFRGIRIDGWYRANAVGRVARVKMSLRRLEQKIRVWRCLSAIRKCPARNVQEVVDFSYAYRKKLIAPFQIVSEITGLLHCVHEIRPRRILEIGTANGGTLFLFTRFAADDAVLVSVDLPGGEFGGGYPQWKVPLFQGFARERQEIQLLRADSHAEETKRDVMKILADAPIDFLFIDGDHTYEGVRADYLMYSGLVRRGGLIAFHDIVDSGIGNPCQVSRFWKEVRQGKEYREFINDPDQGHSGIGLLVRSEDS